MLITTFRGSPKPAKLTVLHILAVEWTDPELNISHTCPGIQILYENQGLMDTFLLGQRITSLKWLPNIQELHFGLFNNP